MTSIHIKFLRKMVSYIFTNSLFLFFARLIFVNTYDVVVDLEQGKLKGTSDVTLFDGRLYFAFYRVPYARPPIEKLRFKNPKPVKKWNKTLDVRTEYHGACAQAHIVHKEGIYGTEDCLHLNIFTPSLLKSTEKVLKAVIVWIHGYAFTSSFSHIHGADFFMDEDVILVTVSHRIGAFGFLKYNDTDQHANMGLKDIVMCLKWIQKNIKQFGGDKTKVTVMGSGSAATFLALLLTTKSSKLFSKSILQSGAMFSASLFQGNHKLEKDRLLDKLKTKGFRDIKEATAKDIVEVSSKIYSSADVINSQTPLIPFTPMIETESKSSLLTKQPEIHFSDNNDDLIKPVLIGFNSKESISEVIPFLHNPNYLRSFAVYFKYMIPFSPKCKYNHTSSTYKEIAYKIAGEYFKNDISVKSVHQFLQYSSDLIKYPIYDFIQRLQQVHGSKLYTYKFTYSGKFNVVKANSISGINTKIKGAASGDEICYMLKCEPIWETYVNIKRNDTNRDRIFIKKITKLWANFAKTGDPTPNTYIGNVTWPPMTQNNDNVFNLGKVFNIIDFKREKRMFAFWNAIYRKYYKDCGMQDHDEL